MLMMETANDFIVLADTLAEKGSSLMAMYQLLIRQMDEITSTRPNDNRGEYADHKQRGLVLNKQASDWLEQYDSLVKNAPLFDGNAGVDECMDKISGVRTNLGNAAFELGNSITRAGE